MKSEKATDNLQPAFDVAGVAAEITAEIREKAKDEYGRLDTLKEQASSLKTLRAEYQEKLIELKGQDSSIFDEITSAMVPSLLGKKKGIKFDIECFEEMIKQIETKALPAVDVELRKLEVTIANQAATVMMKRKDFFQGKMDDLVSQIKDLYEGWGNVALKVIHAPENGGNLMDRILILKELSVCAPRDYFEVQSDTGALARTRQ
ncbi:MAG: hypothetical protein ABSE05_15475 [Syntrophales bacterium]|jgi:hypothetical protein